MEYADGGGGTTALLSPLTYAVFGGFLVCFFMIDTTRFDPVRYDDALMGSPPFSSLSVSISHRLLCSALFFFCSLYLLFPSHRFLLSSCIISH